MEMAPQQTSSCGTQVLQRSLGRWHPALLLQEDQPVTCSQLGPGVSIWPGRIVGSHLPQLPSYILPGTMPSGMLQHETTRSFTDADTQAAMVRNLGVCNNRSAYTDSAIAGWRPEAMAASAFHCADNQGTGGMVRQSSIARYDSASSEALQQYSTVDPITGLPPQPGAPMHAALRRHDSGFEGGLLRHDSDSLAHHMRNPLGTFCYSSSKPGLGGKRSSGSLLWDSAHAEALAGAMQASLQEQRHCRSSGSCQAELWPGLGSRPGSAEAPGSHGEPLSEQCQVWMASPPIAQPRATIHSLWTDERLRAPRRRRQAQQPAPGARRCLLNELTLAAEEGSCQIRSLECAQSACSPMRMDRACSVPSLQLPTVPAGLPEDCMTSPQALTMSASPNDTWQPGRLREFMQGFPNGLPLEDARSIILNVAYGLQERHCDGIIHRRVCPSTVLVPDTPCCDTARLAEGGCTAVLDRTGTFTELERVGDLLYQAPEVQRAFPGTKIIYSAAGDMWSLGVLMYVVLTGAVPPFAQSLAHSRCRGMCADALQATVSAALRCGLDASQPRSPITRGAIALLQSMLQVDPAQRPTAAAVCRHPWALDLPESPPGSPSRYLYHSPQRHAVFQDPLEHGSCGGQDGTTAEQQDGECTAEAMQQRWLQREVLLKGGGGQQSVEQQMGQLLAAAQSGSTGRPGPSKGMLAWLQRFVGRCRRPEMRLRMDATVPEDLQELILQHY